MNKQVVPSPVESTPPLMLVVLDATTFFVTPSVTVVTKAFAV
jgi:hypothetical protein